VKVQIFNQQKDLRISRVALEKAILALVSYKRVKCQQIIIHLVSKKAISAIHAQFFHDPSPTDCISFPIDPLQSDTLGSILGEVFICPKVAVEYAKCHDLLPIREFYLYLVHGFHLLGYDDGDKSSACAVKKNLPTLP
jgi:probable rRNA maturation factor